MEIPPITIQLRRTTPSLPPTWNITPVNISHMALSFPEDTEVLSRVRVWTSVQPQILLPSVSCLSSAFTSCSTNATKTEVETQTTAPLTPLAPPQTLTNDFQLLLYGDGALMIYCPLQMWSCSSEALIRVTTFNAWSLEPHFSREKCICRNVTTHNSANFQWKFWYVQKTFTVQSLEIMFVEILDKSFGLCVLVHTWLFYKPLWGTQGVCTDHVTSICTTFAICRIWGGRKKEKSVLHICVLPTLLLLTLMCCVSVCYNLTLAACP